MTLRARVVLIVTGLVVLGISVASIAAYRSAASELAIETDSFLIARATPETLFQRFMNCD